MTGRKFSLQAASFLLDICLEKYLNFPSIQHHCGYAKGTILLSPVDGFDPFGLIPIYAITPGEYLNVALPSLGKNLVISNAATL